MVTLWVTFLGELELQPVSLLFSLSMNLLSHFCGGHHRFVEKLLDFKAVFILENCLKDKVVV